MSLLEPLQFGFEDDADGEFAWGEISDTEVKSAMFEELVDLGRVRRYDTLGLDLTEILLAL